LPTANLTARPAQQYYRFSLKGQFDFVGLDGQVNGTPAIMLRRA
jgi:hypothetical protein